MKQKIRSALVASLTPSAKPFDVFDTELPGLILRVQPSGLMTYFYACQTKSGNRRRIRLGSTNALTVIQARDEARKILGDIEGGIDPQAEILAKCKKESETTLIAFLDKTYGPWAEQNLVDGANALRRLKACFKTLLNKKLSTLDGWAFKSWKCFIASILRGSAPVKKRFIHAKRRTYTAQFARKII